MRNCLILMFSGLFLVACEDDIANQNETFGCTTVFVPGIVVEIRDAISDTPLAENAVVVITDGDYTETLEVLEYEGPESTSAYSVAGAYERPGVYDINLTLSGYEGWSRSQVEVESGICHVNTVTFTVRLAAME